MSFESPLFLLALLAVPAVVALYVVHHRRRSRVAAQFASPALLPNVVDREPGRLRHVPPAILLIALAALLVAFARPQADDLGATRERDDHARDRHVTLDGREGRPADPAWQPRRSRSATSWRRRPTRTASASSPSRAPPASWRRRHATAGSSS